MYWVMATSPWWLELGSESQSLDGVLGVPPMIHSPWGITTAKRVDLGEVEPLNAVLIT